jgi:hypothetical protein
VPRTADEQAMRAKGDEQPSLPAVVAAGWYHVIGFVYHSLGVQREEWAARYPAA